MSRRRPRASLEQAAPLFAALGDATRLGLVARLSGDGPASLSRLAQGTQLSRQAVSKHLHALEAAGLVTGQRRGRERIWAVQPERLDDAQRWLVQIGAQWDAALQRLAAHVESMD